MSLQGSVWIRKREGERDTAMWMRCPLDASRAFFCFFFSFYSTSKEAEIDPVLPCSQNGVAGLNTQGQAAH